MKLAVLADIHANLVSLQAVTAHLEAWQPDLVVVAGDVINRGPRPLECLRFVQDKQLRAGWLVIRGNHEDYVLSHAQPQAPRHGLEFETHRHSYWTYMQLNGNVSDLATLPYQQQLAAPDGSEVRITHGSMLGTRDGIYPELTEAELRRKIQPTSTLFCVGHTHRPLIRSIDSTLVVNVGSVGLPFDGDPRPSYAQFVWRQGAWQAEIVRVDYDRQRAERDFFETRFFDGSGPLGDLILDEFRMAQSRLYQWTETYRPLVLAGQITMEKSVSEFLAAIGV